MLISLYMDYLLRVPISEAVLVGCSLVATENVGEFDSMPDACNILGT